VSMLFCARWVKRRMRSNNLISKLEQYLWDHLHVLVYHSTNDVSVQDQLQKCETPKDTIVIIWVYHAIDSRVYMTFITDDFSKQVVFLQDVFQCCMTTNCVQTTFSFISFKYQLIPHHTNTEEFMSRGTTISLHFCLVVNHNKLSNW